MASSCSTPPNKPKPPEPETPVVDAIITGVRVPIAAVLTVLLASGFWPLEIVIGFLVIVFRAITEARPPVRNDFKGWPFIAFQGVDSLWRWAFDD